MQSGLRRHERIGREGGRDRLRCLLGANEFGGLAPNLWGNQEWFYEQMREGLERVNPPGPWLRRESQHGPGAFLTDVTKITNKKQLKDGRADFGSQRGDTSAMWKEHSCCCSRDINALGWEA